MGRRRVPPAAVFQAIWVTGLSRRRLVEGLASEAKERLSDELGHREQFRVGKVAQMRGGITLLRSRKSVTALG